MKNNELVDNLVEIATYYLEGLDNTSSSEKDTNDLQNENIKKVCDEVNNKIMNSDIHNKKILIDSPMITNKFANIENIENESKQKIKHYENINDKKESSDVHNQNKTSKDTNNTLNVENAVDATKLATKLATKNDIKKISEKILTEIFDVINDIAQDEYSDSDLFIDIIDDYSEYVKSLNADELEKVIDNIYYYLKDKHFDVVADLVIQDDDIQYAYMNINW